jgi:hypothetical protein
MITQSSLLVMLVRLVDQVPAPPTAKQGRGRPSFYSERLFLKALVIMIIKHLHTPYELLSVLQQPTAEMQALRALLTQGERYPCRRTLSQTQPQIEQRIEGITLVATPSILCSISPTRPQMA